MDSMPKVAQDSTDRNHAGIVLHESEKDMVTLLNAISEHALLLDPQGNILALNDTVERYLDKPKNALMGTCVWDYFPPEVAELRKKEFSGVVATGEAHRYHDYDGRRYFDYTMSPALDDGGHVTRVAVFACDISDRYRAERELIANQERLRGLASKMAFAEEKERQRIATHLHNELGHLLASACIQLGELRKTGGAEIEGAVDCIRQMMNQAVVETRSLTFELGSPILYQLGLGAAVRELCEDYSGTHNIPFSFRDDERVNPRSGEIRITLYQAIREIFTNAAKHATARQVNISFCWEENMMAIIIEDDGVGFDVAKGDASFSRRGGFGLFNIREQLAHFGGHLKVVSSPGKGTRVTLLMPPEEQAGSPGASITWEKEV